MSGHDNPLRLKVQRPVICLENDEKGLVPGYKSNIYPLVLKHKKRFGNCICTPALIRYILFEIPLSLCLCAFVSKNALFKQIQPQFLAYRSNPFFVHCLHERIRIAVNRIKKQRLYRFFAIFRFYGIFRRFIV